MAEATRTTEGFILPGFHGVLSNVEGCKTVEEVQSVAGLDWRVDFTPVRAETPGIVPGLVAPVSVSLKDYKAPYKVETGEHLGCVVGKGYTAVQNTAMLEVGQFLVGEGLAQWSWAGQVQGGCRVAAQLRVPTGNFGVRRFDGSEDEHATHFALWNGHDGRTRLIGLISDIRLACFNELPALFKEGKAWSGRHTLGIPRTLEQLKLNVLKALDGMRFEQEEMQLLADSPFDGRGFAGFLAQLLTGEDNETEAMEIVAAAGSRKLTRFENRASLLARLFTHGRGNKGHDMYDALQSVTEWVDHYRGDRETEVTAEREIEVLARHKIETSRRDEVASLIESFESDTLGGARETVEVALSARERRVTERRFVSAQWGSGADVKQRARRLLVERARA